MNKISVDLFTGFLGTGKTTMIKEYAKYLMKKGQNIAIIENDFGGVNVDRLLLQELEGDLCDVEQIVGGNVPEDWQRRFRAKLIAMGMLGYDHVIVEPSGIFDTDSFFDVLQEDTVRRWFCPGSVVAMMDSDEIAELSTESLSLMATQLSQAGIMLFAKENSQDLEKKKTVLNKLNEELTQEAPAETAQKAWVPPVLWKNLYEYCEQDFEQIETCGYGNGRMEKWVFRTTDVYQTIYFMEEEIAGIDWEKTLDRLFSDDAAAVYRVKGFWQQEEQWYQLNATKKHRTISPVPFGQNVMVVIGEHLQKEELQKQFILR